MLHVTFSLYLVKLKRQQWLMICLCSCPDEKTREVLKLVCDLYALERIWKDIGTYRNVDYVAPNKAKAIHKLVDYLSYQVRLVARELVDAFDVPDQIIRAPIGMQSEAYAQYTQGVGFYRQPT
uniref:Acyl-CoA oxidase C-terminal domain-containing protein n=1 Tax=Aegilops tauschii subsp. strangulata TaxID=200361 RepID=A0A453QXN3_AEGTS